MKWPPYMVLTCGGKGLEPRSSSMVKFAVTDDLSPSPWVLSTFCTVYNSSQLTWTDMVLFSYLLEPGCYDTTIKVQCGWKWYKTVWIWKWPPTFACACVCCVVAMGEGRTQQWGGGIRPRPGRSPLFQVSHTQNIVSSSAELVGVKGGGEVFIYRPVQRTEWSSLRQWKLRCQVKSTHFACMSPGFETQHTQCLVILSLPKKKIFF